MLVFRGGSSKNKFSEKEVRHAIDLEQQQVSVQNLNGQNQKLLLSNTGKVFG